MRNKTLKSGHGRRAEQNISFLLPIWAHFQSLVLILPCCNSEYWAFAQPTKLERIFYNMN